MMSEDILKQIHQALCQDLLTKIQSGEASSADLSVARQFLRDNGIDCEASNNKPMLNLASSLPFDDDGHQRIRQA